MAPPAGLAPPSKAVPLLYFGMGEDFKLPLLSHPVKHAPQFATAGPRSLSLPWKM